MIKNNLVIKIAGPAGYGVMATGHLLAKAALRGGLNIFNYQEYPSLIRGGHNTYEVRISEEKIFSQIKGIDLLVALNENAVTLHLNELKNGGGIIYDKDELDLERIKISKKDINFFGVPFTELIKKIGASKIMKNTLASGVIAGMLKFEDKILEEVIKTTFKKKGDEIINKNIKALKIGYQYGKENFSTIFPYELEKKASPKKMLIAGNEAIALGALQAGVKFFAAYPMTPATSILHYLAAKEREYNLVVKQTEDEIGAMNMVVGAGFAGVRAMTATSGGGFSLMVEALGMAGMTEVPLVAVEAQRGGPSTGLPTWTEQGDLLFMLHASQGEFPRVIIAPGDQEECFYLTHKAFNLAEKYQLPVLILTDKYLASSQKSCSLFETKNLKIERGKYLNEKEPLVDQSFKRYLFTPDGVSMRTFPGQNNGLHVASSYEHDETGFTTEDEDITSKMKEKRLKKLETILNDEELGPELIGPEKADLTLVLWGSTKMPAEEALKRLNQENLKVNLLHFNFIWPFPKEKTEKILSQAKKILLIENNQTAQLGQIIKTQTGIEIAHKFLKYGGRSFWPEEIVEKVKQLI